MFKSLSYLRVKTKIDYEFIGKIISECCHCVFY